MKTKVNSINNFVLKNNYILIFLFVFFTSCTDKQKSFTFVQMCDTQLGFGGYEHDVESFKTAVKQINALDPDFVVICGDLVDNPNDSTYTDFKKIVDGFHMPCYPAPGNHDVGNIANDSTLSYYRETVGKDYHQFLHHGYSFVVVNTQLWKEDIGNESEKFNNWFKKTIEDQHINEKPVFVIGHYPLFVKTADEKEGYFNLPLEKRKELLKLFGQNNVVAYLSGHTHTTEINQYKNIQLVSGEVTSKNFDGNPLGLRLWTVSDTIKHQFVPLQPDNIDKTEIGNR